ncbi:MAG: hypothetical protein JWM21_4479 [Acidobacteria bacterium]|nr:hypothetical protein [Acidobacteriota bacterium]
MTLEEKHLELKKLLGETVSCKLIACSSILLYFFGEPRDKGVVSICINPPWRYQQQGEIIVGSGDFPFRESDFISKEEYQKTFDRMCALTDGLDGAVLIDCEVDLETSDLLLEFSDGQVVRNFMNSAFTDAAWSI